MHSQRSSQAHCAPAMFPSIVCDQPDDVANVTALKDYVLDVCFNDGLRGQVDLKRLVRAPDAGVFSALSDPARFVEVFVEFGAVTWPGAIDLAPDAMYAQIKAHGCRVP